MKHLLGHTLFAARLHAMLLRDAAVVVAFHRVADAPASDALTTDVRMFERYCRFFRRHFRVVPLGDVVDRFERGLPANRELAITFDDGYLDNYENARPVLERLSLPATFFIVTEWMGTKVWPWWDEERGVRHPWMTWDHVRSLHRAGFEIGAHGQTHVDLGQVEAAEARDEILGARLTIERQIGARVDLFAYPYGGRNNITNSNRTAVKAAGFRCCCSNFGGVNLPDTDPFDLLRIPISPWYASPHEFGFDVALGRSVLAASGGPRPVGAASRVE
jgi:peptidoglycan/xylan/chitin deacetylase (PgdA/CDA1 family)